MNKAVAERGKRGISTIKNAFDGVALMVGREFKELEIWVLVA